MTYPLKSANLPENPDLTNFYRYPSGFSDEEIYAITQLAEDRDFEPGTAGGSVNPQYRKQNITWLSYDDSSAWVYAKVAAMIEEANSTLWGFTLDGMREDFQFGRYGPGDFFDWHLDMPEAPTKNGFRKISVVIQLSDRKVFEGGDLELKFAKDPVNTRMDRGDVVVFPSYALHRVTPITQGHRYSLVLWAHGRTFQ